jgi:flagellar motility protein MotE (MotC chaperone)
VRYARQSDALAAMSKELSDRIDALEKKRAEYETWVKKREDLLAKADASVVAIYSQMRPDAAAKQIAVMEDEAAAAILSKVNPRIASAILNEMDARVAAHLTNVMAGMPNAAVKKG